MYNAIPEVNHLVSSR